MASPTKSSDLTAFLPNYWDTVLGENLYPNLYFYQFGTKRTVPRNFGTSIKIPRLLKQNIVTSVGTEGAIINPCPISDEFISGTMNQFAGAYKHSDVLVMTALSDVIELSLIDIARDIARRMDRTIRNALSGTGTQVFGDSAQTATHASQIRDTDVIRASQIVKSVVTLDANDNPRPPDNHYPTIIHPNTVFDLQTHLSGGQWLDVTKYTEGNADRIYLGEVGRLYGARFVTSSNIRRAVLSEGNSGVREYMFAPDSYYVTEINDMTARTYVKQLGSGGTADPVNQQATVGAKVYFGVVPVTYSSSSSEVRMIRLVHGTSIAGGDTTA